jgi:hypothetical protein
VLGCLGLQLQQLLLVRRWGEAPLQQLLRVGCCLVPDQREGLQLLGARLVAGRWELWLALFVGEHVLGCPEVPLPLPQLLWVDGLTGWRSDLSDGVVAG